MVKLAVAMMLTLALCGCSTVAGILADPGIQQQLATPPQRDYVAQPFTPLNSPLSGQQRTGTQQASDEYQTVMVNTPSGIVYKRCKMLNGKAAYCL